MTYTIKAFFVSVSVLLVAACGGDDVPKTPDIVWEHPTIYNDGEVKQAITQARDTLPLFLHRLDNQKPGDEAFKLLVRKPAAEPSYEYNYVWVGDLTKTDIGFKGVIRELAENISSDHRDADILAFTLDEVYDWSFVNDGIWGSFTTLGKLEALAARSESLNGESTDLTALKDRYRDVSELSND